MKIILLRDVPKIGRKYEVKEIADGHAVNFLIPRSLAEVATSQAIKKLEVLKRRMAEKETLEGVLLAKSLADLDGKTIELREKVNEKGHLFAQVHKEEVIKLLKEQFHFEVLSESIIINKPIKEVGEFEIEIKVQNKTAKLKLVVKAS